MNRLAQTGILQNGTLNFKMGIDEILHIEAFGVWFFLIGSGSNYKQDGILPYAEPYLPAQRAFQFLME